VPLCVMMYACRPGTLSFLLPSFVSWIPRCHSRR
jgi:hypothetical protein